MSKAAFDKIAEGLTEALSIARGQSAPHRRLSHRLVGYGWDSGDVAVEHVIPAHHLEHAMRAAKVGADDPDAALCYRLSQYDAQDIASTIGVRIPSGGHNFYLEGFAKPLRKTA